MHTVHITLPNSDSHIIRATPRGYAAWTYYHAATRHAPAGTRIAVHNAAGRRLASTTQR